MEAPQVLGCAVHENCMQKPLSAANILTGEVSVTLKMNRNTLQPLKPNIPRRSTFGGKRGGLNQHHGTLSIVHAHPVNEERDMKSKRYKIGIVKRLLSLFMRERSDHPFTREKLLIETPMTKDVLYIFEFLFKLIDDNYELEHCVVRPGARGRINHEKVYRLLSILGYQGRLRAKDLMGILPYSWSVCLYVLDLIMDMINYLETKGGHEQENDMVDDDDEGNMMIMDRQFDGCIENVEIFEEYQFLRQVYPLYMAGKDNHVQDAHNHRHCVLEDKIRSLTAQINDMKHRIRDNESLVQSSVNTDSDLKQSHATNTSLKKELQAFRQRINSMKNRLETLGKKLYSDDEQKYTFESNKVHLQTEMQQLQSMARQQNNGRDLGQNDFLSKEQIQRMQAEIQAERQRLERVSQNYSQVHNNLWSLKQKRHHTDDEIVQMISRWNGRNQELSEILGDSFHLTREKFRDDGFWQQANEKLKQTMKMLQNEKMANARLLPENERRAMQEREDNDMVDEDMSVQDIDAALEKEWMALQRQRQEQNKQNAYEKRNDQQEIEKLERLKRDIEGVAQAHMGIMGQRIRRVNAGLTAFLQHQK